MGLSNSLPNSILQPGVCTSSTRPANPYAGYFIYETDTGNLLQYYGATTGWRPPWNLPWGRLATSTSTGQTSIAGTPTITDTALSITYTQVLNRWIKLSAYGQVHTTATTFQTMVLYFRDSANTVFNTSSTITQQDNYSSETTPQHIYIAGSTGSITMKLSATRSAGVGTQWWGARTSVNGADPYTTGTCWLMAEDIGPSGAAPAS